MEWLISEGAYKRRGLYLRGAYKWSGLYLRAPINGEAYI